MDQENGSDAGNDFDECMEAFRMFDKDGSNSIDVYELYQCLTELGLGPTQSEVIQVFEEVDEDHSGSIDAQEFVKLYERFKEKFAGIESEKDTISAFVALGGNPDRSGEIKLSRLRQTIDFFRLNFDVEALISDADADGSGFIDYEEFKLMIHE